MVRCLQIEKVFVFLMCLTLCASAQDDDEMSKIIQELKRQVESLRNVQKEQEEIAKVTGPRGTEKWKIVYSGPEIRHVETDEDGNVYVAGRRVTKFDTLGVELWSFSTPNIGYVQALAVDSSGHAYISGITDNDHYVTEKLTRDGQRVWSARSDNVVSSFGLPTDIMVNGAGEVFVVGFIEKEVADTRIVVIGYSEDGREVSVTIGGGTGSTGQFVVPDHTFDYMKPLTFDESGNVYAMFESYSWDADPPLVLTKFDAHGSLLWSSPCTGYREVGISAIMADAEGSVYIAGEGVKYEPRIVKRRNDGEVLWTKNFEGPTIRSIDTDSQQNLYTAWNSGNVVVVTKLTATGQVEWVRHVEYSLGVESTGFLTQISIDERGNLAGVMECYAPGFSDVHTVLIMLGL